MYRLILFASCETGIVVILYESSGLVYFRIIFLYAVVSDRVESYLIFILMNFHCYFSLQTKSIGCRLGNMITNHLLFADIAVVFAPSTKGLQQLLEICSDFAVSHNVVFNVN